MDINNNNINGLIIKENNLTTSTNMNYLNNIYYSPNKRFNTENINDNKSSNINNININNKSINANEELNSLIEKVSKILKDYFNNDTLYFKNIKLISESINEQTLFGRCSINDIYLYLNQITYPRYNGVLANMNEKYIKEKLNLINDRLNKIEELKDNMNQNIKSSEIELITFYEESKNILQRMTIFYKYGKNYSQKEYKNLEELNLLKNKYNNLLKENNLLKINLKINNSFQLQNQSRINNNSLIKNNNKLNLTMLNPKRNNSCSKSSKQKYIMSASYSKKKKAPKINIHSLKKEYQKNGNSRQKDKNMENIGINIIVDLADMILKFLNDMKNLQEYIMKKNIGVKELKKNFETNKKNLRYFCEKIINNKNSPEKIKSINIKNMRYKSYKNNKSKEKNNFENKINKLEVLLIEKNNKIKSLEKEITEYVEKNNQLIKQNNELNQKIKNNNININQNQVDINQFKEKENKLLIELDEKNTTIKDLNIKLKDQINQNKEILLLKEENIKLKREINKNNFDNKIYSDIKDILYNINEVSQKNINELINKDKQFDLEIKKEKNTDSINQINESNENKEKKEIINNLNNNKELTNEYGLLLGQFKEYNALFEQINKNNI